MSWLRAVTIDHDTATLADAEVHHLSRVLRARPGAPVRLIDGRGRRAVAVWRGGHACDVSAVEDLPRGELRVAVAIGARETLEESLRRTAEFGVREVALVVTAHSRDAAGRRLPERGRLEKILVSGAAQAGNPWLPELHAAVSWPEFRAAQGDNAIVVLDPAAAATFGGLAPGRWLAVGPEGGWRSDEIAGCSQASLGPYVLRTHVAVAAALAVATVAGAACSA